MKLDPVEVCFAEKKEEPGQAKQDSCTISVNVGKRNLYLITVSGYMTHQNKAMYTALLLEHAQMSASIRECCSMVTVLHAAALCFSLQPSFVSTCLHQSAYKIAHAVKLLIVMSSCRLNIIPMVNTISAFQVQPRKQSMQMPLRAVAHCEPVNNESDAHVWVFIAAGCQGPATGTAFGAVLPGPVWGHRAAPVVWRWLHPTRLQHRSHTQGHIKLTATVFSITPILAVCGMKGCCCCCQCKTCKGPACLFVQGASLAQGCASTN